jgi:hypothetical protein
MYLRRYYEEYEYWGGWSKRTVERVEEGFAYVQNLPENSTTSIREKKKKDREKEDKSAKHMVIA